MNHSPTRCPSCDSTHIFHFYEVKEVPVHSVMLVATESEALSFPRGDISLGLCRSCGFVSNYSFDSNLQNYASNSYEATQRYSATFNSFHSRLASDLIERYDLRNKRVIEIGCGQGEFLSLICEMGDNYGLGFDPAFTRQRLSAPLPDKVEVISDYYSKKYAIRHADLICCKMTLEHIHPVRRFVQMVFEGANRNSAPWVFFQVPNGQHVFKTTAFWDIYYEHCSYFTSESLAQLFRSCGFRLRQVWTDYDDQYLMIDAAPGGAVSAYQPVSARSPEELEREVSEFAQRSELTKEMWKEKIWTWKQQGQKTVLWGGGSKSVAFLTTLGITLDQIQYVVDINPYKDGTYIVGTGQKVVGPKFLVEYSPDQVIIMNPIYYQEIQQQLGKMGLTPTLISVDSIGSEVSV
jgi:hypothetical protein